MTRRPDISTKNPGGFTLVELMVSSAVLAIVLSVMFAALSTGLSVWRNTDSKILADREARAIELVLMRDLANIVMPASPNLWPTNASVRRSSIQYLKFLTIAPPEMQRGAGQVGDVCYVEYTIVPATNTNPASGVPVAGSELRRLFWPSGQTYSDVIASNGFPTNDFSGTNFLPLGVNLLPTNAAAARGLGGDLIRYINPTHFVLIGTNGQVYTGRPSASNYPVALEVTIAVSDPETLANLTNLPPNSILRNAGLYSFRIPLPKPSNVR